MTKRYKGGVEPPKAVCPNEAAHIDEPIGYCEWHDWADHMGISHFQILCEGCGRYKIWIPKFVASPAFWSEYAVRTGTGSQPREVDDEVVSGEVVDDERYPMWEEWSEPRKELRYFKLTISEEFLANADGVIISLIEDSIGTIKMAIRAHKEHR